MIDIIFIKGEYVTKGGWKLVNGEQLRNSDGSFCWHILRFVGAYIPREAKYRFPDASWRTCLRPTILIVRQKSFFRNSLILFHELLHHLSSPFRDKQSNRFDRWLDRHICKINEIGVKIEEKK